MILPPPGAPATGAGLLWSFRESFMRGRASPITGILKLAGRNISIVKPFPIVEYWKRFQYIGNERVW
jgi:hypothetical protein